MNTTYLIIELLITLFAVYTIIHSEVWWEHYAKSANQMFSLLALIASLGMFPIGFIPGTGEDQITIKDAYSQKMGNEIIVKVDGWPTQITEKIEFIDVPLQIKRVEPHNAWGIDCTSAYKFQVQVKPIPSIKTER